MIWEILSYLWLVLPVYFANMAPVFVRKLDVFASPIDFGRKIGGKRILGDNKTWRGLFVGILVGVLVAVIQMFLYGYDFFIKLSLVNYWQINVVYWGFLMGLGAIGGDVVGSFIKRRTGVKPGKRFLIVDQLDFIIGGLLMLWIVFPITWKMILVILPLTFVLHIFINNIGYYLKLKETRW